MLCCRATNLILSRYETASCPPPFLCVCVCVCADVKVKLSLQKCIFQRLQSCHWRERHTHTNYAKRRTLQQQNVEATILLPGRRRPVRTPRQVASQPGTRSGGGLNCWCCVPGGLDSIVNHTLLFYFHTLLFYFMRPRFRLQCLASTRDEVSVGTGHVVPIWPYSVHCWK